MSRRSQENWQRGQDYWIYLPTNLSDPFVPPTSLTPRGRTRAPWSLFAERSTPEPSYGLARLSPITPPRPSLRLLFVDDYDPYDSPTVVDSPPPYYQPLPRLTQPSRPNQQSMNLTLEDQTKALNKLRKQFYNPHLSNIVKRLGTKSATAKGGTFKAADDVDDGKRCAICLDDFESNKFVTVTPCDHMFHEECIVPWIQGQAKCPVCRYAIV